MARISVIGPGAIGGTVAVRLLEAGNHTVTICARSPISQLSVQTEQGTSTFAPTLVSSPDKGEPVDWVFIATKAYDAAGVAPWLQSLVGPLTRVAVLQNGVEHVARFSPYVPEAQIVPVILNLPVERIAPGQFRQRRPGRLTVADGENGRQFAELFRDSVLEVVAAPDFQRAAWRKLAQNCAGAVSALVLKPAIISHDEAVADIMRALVRECVAVGKLEGAAIDEHLVEEVVDIYRRDLPNAINSLHGDRIAGRPMEIDARNGVIIRLGKKHGVPTPTNQIIAALLTAASA